MNTLQSIQKGKLVAVIRGARGEDVISAARALKAGSITILKSRRKIEDLASTSV